MAEFLIKAVDATHSDPVKDKRGCYKRGDVKDAKPGGWPWGKAEGPPKFVVIKVPDLDLMEAQKYTEEHQEPKTQTRTWKRTQWNAALKSGDYGEFLSQPILVIPGDRDVVLRGEIMTRKIRRKFKLLLDNFPQTTKDELKAKGMIIVSWSQIKALVQNKVTQTVEL